MISAIMITINGDMFLFKDYNFKVEEYNALQYLSDSDFKTGFLNDSESNICSRFVEKAKTKLNITLDPIKISFVLRIK